jgi:hypothetical protein
MTSATIAETTAITIAGTKAGMIAGTIDRTTGASDRINNLRRPTHTSSRNPKSANRFQTLRRRSSCLLMCAEV